mgnify:CR=1 FL=1
MPSITEHAEEVRSWLKENYTPLISKSRDPSIEEFFEICRLMREFEEASDAYTYVEGSNLFSEETTHLRIKILHSVLATKFPHINPHSRYLIPKNVVLADHFNSPHHDICAPFNQSRMEMFFATGEFPANP